MANREGTSIGIPGGADRDHHRDRHRAGGGFGGVDRPLDRTGAPSNIDTLFAELRGDSTHDIKGVLVLRDSRAAAQAYFNGDDSSTLHDLPSATKSITALLVGSPSTVASSPASTVRFRCPSRLHGAGFAPSPSAMC